MAFSYFSFPNYHQLRGVISAPAGLGSHAPHALHDLVVAMFGMFGNTINANAVTECRPQRRIALWHPKKIGNGHGGISSLAYQKIKFIAWRFYTGAHIFRLHVWPCFWEQNLNPDEGSLRLYMQVSFFLLHHCEQICKSLYGYAQTICFWWGWPSAWKTYQVPEPKVPEPKLLTPLLGKCHRASNQVRRNPSRVGLWTHYSSWERIR